MNQVTLIGRITRNLNLKNSTSGKAYVYFSLAINDIKDRTDFVNCVAWNKTAENMARFVGKGSLVSVIGRISTRKDNNDQYITEVVANNVTFLDNRRKDFEGEPEQVVKNENQPVVDSSKFANDEYDDQISFVNNSNVNNTNNSDDSDDDEAIVW